MPKFRIDLKEEWYQTVYIEADNTEDALAMVKDGAGEYGALEYSQTLDYEAPVIEP